jgi:hypothetical protein
MQRGAAFRSRIEALETDARNKLRLGATKEVVQRFFADNKIPLTFYGSEALGTVAAAGCSPFGCGSDAAIIGVRVKVDESGAVQSTPHVIGMYTNCL